MATQISKKKRSIQSKVKNAVNTQYLTKFRTNLNKFKTLLKREIPRGSKLFREINSILAKAVKKGILKNNISPESYPRYQNKLKKINFFF